MTPDLICPQSLINNKYSNENQLCMVLLACDKFLKHKKFIELERETHKDRIRLETNQSEITKFMTLFLKLLQFLNLHILYENRDTFLKTELEFKESL